MDCNKLNEGEKNLGLFLLLTSFFIFFLSVFPAFFFDFALHEDHRFFDSRNGSNLFDLGLYNFLIGRPVTGISTIVLHELFYPLYIEDFLAARLTNLALATAFIALFVKVFLASVKSWPNRVLFPLIVCLAIFSLPSLANTFIGVLHHHLYVAGFFGLLGGHIFVGSDRNNKKTRKLLSSFLLLQISLLTYPPNALCFLIPILFQYQSSEDAPNTIRLAAFCMFSFCCYFMISLMSRNTLVNIAPFSEYASFIFSSYDLRIDFSFASILSKLNDIWYNLFPRVFRYHWLNESSFLWILNFCLYVLSIFFFFLRDISNKKPLFKNRGLGFLVLFFLAMVPLVAGPKVPNYYRVIFPIMVISLFPIVLFSQTFLPKILRSVISLALICVVLTGAYGINKATQTTARYSQAEYEMTLKGISKILKKSPELSCLHFIKGEINPIEHSSRNGIPIFHYSFNHNAWWGEFFAYAQSGLSTFDASTNYPLYDCGSSNVPDQDKCVMQIKSIAETGIIVTSAPSGGPSPHCSVSTEVDFKTIKQ